MPSRGTSNKHDDDRPQLKKGAVAYLAFEAVLGGARKAEPIAKAASRRLKGRESVAFVDGSRSHCNSRIFGEEMYSTLDSSKMHPKIVLKHRQQPSSPLLYSIDVWQAHNSRLTQRETSQ